MGNAVWKVMGTGGAILAGMIANKVVDAVWDKAGGDSSIDPTDPDSPIIEALIYAAAIGLAMGIARTMATRKAAQVYARSAGQLPDEMRRERLND
ncbi:hypothetical protein GCM10022199_03380 [Marihabitans asiaticum]|uniref:Uncharacterized protein DUF4235 n=1 Tax=Marihabitans asiaticum TaxID=415218 RepID=A0A560WE96_9MICO|nr:DUF4235 domain-containing protein [Marihabitans asiaticum]TWD15987.1 uncharacterized protein DUF4235 [Marihabitans asiaticum]